MMPAMRLLFSLLATLMMTALSVATDLTPKDLVAQFYQAHRSNHDPLVETKLLGQYFDAPLLKLYLRDQRESKGEVGRLDGDPLYNAQDMEISNFSIASAETVKGETHVTVRFKNIGKPTRVVYVLKHDTAGWRISDIRYDDGSSLKKILQADN
jgi:hypothetical protein